MIPRVLLFVGIVLASELSSESTTTKSPPLHEDPRCVPGCFFDGEYVKDDGTFPQNCTTVCSQLKITYKGGINETRLTNLFKNMKHLIGQLEIHYTDYKNFKFLAGLETIDCYNTGIIDMLMNNQMKELGMTSLTNVSCGFIISNAYRLEKLNLPKMVLVSSPFSNDSSPILDILISPQSYSEEFCITIEEMTNFISHGISDMNERTSGLYCEMSNKSTSLTQKTCDLAKSTFAKLDSGCVNLRGNLTIQKGDESLVQKLENVETIFGYLYINGTDLTNTSFLGKLRNVISLTADHPTILVESNQLLTNVSFPSLELISRTMYNPIVFNKNNAELFKDSKVCFGIRNQAANRTIWRVEVDGKSCEEMETAGNTDNSAQKLNETLAWIFLFVVFYVDCFWN